MKFMFLSVLLAAPSLWAGNWTKQKNDELKVELGVIANAFAFQLKTPKEATPHTANFDPNVGSRTSLGIGYRNLSASLSTANPTRPEDDLNYGTSTSTDFQFRFYGKRTYEFSYQAYSGYYIKNSGDLDQSYANVPAKIQRPDISTRNTSFNLFWNFNEEDYSLAVGLGQNGIQKEGGWANFAIFSASDSDIRGDSPLIPAVASSLFGSLSSLEKVQRQLYALGYGIGGVLTAGGVYATGLVAAGAGYQKVKADYGSGQVQELSGTGSFATLRLGLGHNGEKHIFGLQAIMDIPATLLSDGELVQSTIEGRFFYAYRFDGVNLPPLNWVSSFLD
jgi:hypothetical protein